MLIACGAHSGQESVPENPVFEAPSNPVATSQVGAALDLQVKVEPATASALPSPAQGNLAPAPSTVFRDSRASRPAWFAAMAKRVDPGPAGDGWAEEAFAQWAESHWHGVLVGTHAGLDWIAKSCSAPGGLEPVSWENLPGGASLKVRESRHFKASGPVSGQGGHESWLVDLQQALAPDPSLGMDAGIGRDAMIQVHRVTAMQDGGFEVAVRMRVWERDGNAAWSRTLESRQIWSAGAIKQLQSFEPLHVQESWTSSPLFVDRTRQALSQFALPDHSLYAGGTELAGRHDRLFSGSTQYLGMHGLAVGDVNGDGLEDLYVARSAGFANHLFLRQADGSLRDVALEAGVADLDDTGGVLICDLDGDGARDLVAGLGARIVISWNDGQGHFTERTLLMQEPDASMVYSICAADPDGDGDLDLYDTRYFKGGRQGSAPTPYHDANNGAPNSFWRNDGARGFEDATQEVGLDEANRRFSLAALWEDLDGDGDLDLYVTNDFGRNNLYRNDGGHFVDIAEDSDAIDMAASMGISAADVDRDGNLDLYISNMYTAAGERILRNARFQAQAEPEVRESYRGHARGNTLLMGQGNGRFKFRGDMAGTGPGGWSWGSVFLDFDMNGYPDLVVPNGFATGKRPDDLASFFWRVVVNASPNSGEDGTEYLKGWQCITQMAIEDGLSWNGFERHYAYWNLGGGRFADISAVSGLDLLEDGRCAAVVDWDMDGRPDLWLAHRSAPVIRFMHNQTKPSGHWISLELKGAAPNTDAVGALVQIRQGDVRSEARVYAGEGYLGGGSKRRLFGLGGLDQDVMVVIRWPDGQVQELEALAVDRLYAVQQGKPALAIQPQVQAFSESVQGAAITGTGQAMRRVIPAARLPLAAWDLPDFSKQRPTIADLGPGPVLVYVYGTWQGGGSVGLAGLAKAQGSSSYALRVVNVDGPRQAEPVRAQLSELGLIERSGRGGRRVRNLIDTILGEVLGAAKDRTLPLGFLFDGEGSLAAIYMDGLPLEQVEQDAQLLLMEQAGTDSGGLAGGRWFGEPRQRAILPLAAFLRRAGESRLAAGMEQWVAAHRATPK